jgi:hypothetical protein
MKVKLIISHFLITAIIITLISVNDFSEKGYLATFFFSLFLYLLSGYIATNTNKIMLFDTFIIAIIGTIIWLLCYISSPNDFNYKGHNGGSWFFYQLYIMVNSPLNFVDNISNYFNTSKAIRLTSDLIFPLIFSLFQCCGAIIKQRILKMITHK